MNTRMGEKFDLTWKDYNSNIAKSFSSLRHEDKLNDVTLVSDDHVQISAHKVVLSSSSEYFKDIFIKNKHSHPMLCLVGVSSQEINHVLDYIYHGQVQIHQDNLDLFLGVAQKFQLEGLVGQTENEINVESSKRDNHYEVELPSFSNDNDVVNLKKEIARTASESETVPVSEMFNNIDELDSRINQEISRDTNGYWQCGRCPKIAKNKGHIKEHFESHIDGLSFPCEFCDKTCRSRMALRNHLYHKHRFC